MGDSKPPAYCVAVGCQTVVAQRKLFCRKHWNMVPESFHPVLWKWWGKKYKKDGSIRPEWLLILQKCRKAVATLEGQGHLMV